MDLEKIQMELKVFAQKLPLPKIPSKPLSAPKQIKPLSTPQNKGNALPSFNESKITFGPDGSAKLPKEFFTSEGKLKNPQQARQALYNAKKEKLIKEQADNKFLENSSKEILKINSQVSRQIAIENFSSIAKKGFYIFAGIVAASILFSNLKPKSQSKTKEKIIESIDKPSLNVLKLKNDLNNLSKTSQDESIKKDCEFVLKVISYLESGANVDDAKKSALYAKYLKAFKEKLLDLSFKVDNNMKEQLSQYIIFIDGLGAMK